MSKISVVCPVYKAEKYLDKCIQSVLNQSFTDLELILVDDGSPDKCAQICDMYAKTDSRVRVIHQSNSGHVAARSNGAKAAKSEYVCFVDSDDWVSSDLLETAYSSVQKYKCDIVSYDIIVEKENSNIHYTQNIAPGFYDKLMLESKIYPSIMFDKENHSFGISPSLCNKLFKTELLLKHINSVSSEVKIGEDLAIVLSVMLDANSYYYINKFLYHYRYTPNSITKKYDNKFAERNEILFNTIEDKISKYKNYNLDEQLMYYKAYISAQWVRSECENDKSLYKRTKSIKDKISTYSHTWNDIKKVSLKFLNADSWPFLYFCCHKMYAVCILLMFFVNTKAKIKSVFKDM